MAALELQCSPLGDQLYEVLRSAILNGEFTLGQRISVQALSEQFRVSVTPVRDALRRLHGDGLIRVVPRRGTFVFQFSAQDVREIFQSRQIIELAAVEALPTISEQTLAKMTALAQEMQELLDGEAVLDYSRYLDLDEQFHRCIVEILQNRRLTEFHEGLKAYSYVARALSVYREKRMPQTHKEHCKILEALRRRDVAGAKQAITTHLQHAAEDIIHRMSPAIEDAPEEWDKGVVGE